jgi:hypothetical protein
MGCFWKHDWGKWSKANVVGVVGKPDEKATIQERYCDRCGKYQRVLRTDTLR